MGSDLPIDYKFTSSELQEQALTHKSYHNENLTVSIGDNERLEFLGDAVLDLVLSELLMSHFPSNAEGDLSKMRASLVNETDLAELATQLDIGPHVRLGKGEQTTQGAQKPSILASTLEALFGAIFLDGGYEEARRVISKTFEEKLGWLDSNLTFFEDSKTQLQEIVQGRYQSVPVYQVIEESGPAHDRTFVVQLSINGRVVAKGEGKSKKVATQKAANQALKELQ